MESRLALLLPSCLVGLCLMLTALGWLERRRQRLFPLAG